MPVLGALPNPQGNLSVQQMGRTKNPVLHVDSNLWLPKYMSGNQNLSAKKKTII